jgi:hypothetical protein
VQLWARCTSQHTLQLAKMALAQRTASSAFAGKSVRAGRVARPAQLRTRVQVGSIRTQHRVGSATTVHRSEQPELRRFSSTVNPTNGGKMAVPASHPLHREYCAVQVAAAADRKLWAPGKMHGVGIHPFALLDESSSPCFAIRQISQGACIHRGDSLFWLQAWLLQST